MALSYITRAESTSNLTTYSFTSQSFGDEASDRQIIIAVNGYRSTAQADLSSATIGGVSATLSASRVSANDVSAIFIANVPTGTTGTVSVTFGTDQTEAAIAIYRATATSTTATNAGSEVNEDPISATIASIPKYHYLIASAMVNASATATWTGATEAYDDTLTEAGSVFGAYTDITTDQTNYVLSCDHTVLSTNGPVMVWAIFQYTPPPSGGSPIFFGNTAIA